MILLDTHAWVRWLHPEIGRKLPDGLRTWLEAADAPLAVSVISVATAQARGARLVTADETIQTYPNLSTVWANPAGLASQIEADAP